MKGKRATSAAPNRRAGFILIETKPCDCCDQIKDCASIDIGLVNFVWIICKDCLNEFITKFEE